MHHNILTISVIKAEIKICIYVSTLYITYVLYIICVTALYKYVITQRPKILTVSWPIITAVCSAAFLDPIYSLNMLSLGININEHESIIFLEGFLFRLCWYITVLGKYARAINRFSVHLSSWILFKPVPQSQLRKILHVLEINSSLNQIRDGFFSLNYNKEQKSISICTW